mmetsp:Transcript_6334/g.7268  ORF Transcript_6334/g.7268 Transcript_6334/m.7268 type:complete len:146 (-) Transcript_6334:100-537(-)|eukprot:CAMPEP_0168340438 /NCGR_PEP_ID=MMETSP0213-20121227/14062_1 /TAXON_ID=151035 /ORGANISM="Euplotes harpa, Strain FSP1.4" /LENGTH=145 /DNA_ID=CAMNT_0008346671 /DNA_START=47 /DNA_END=484 /DNA_ORIENTATION=-
MAEFQNYLVPSSRVSHHKSAKSMGCFPVAAERRLAGESKLLQKRRQAGFSLAPIETAKSEESQTFNAFMLVRQMKEKSSLVVPTITSKSHSCKDVDYCKDLDYIFVKPETAKKQGKELRLNQFLDGAGVFQINLGVAMKEYTLTF